jgi:hypothetical protein
MVYPIIEAYSPIMSYFENLMILGLELDMKCSTEYRQVFTAIINHVNYKSNVYICIKVYSEKVRRKPKENERQCYAERRR